jgi:hypothetical protein
MAQPQTESLYAKGYGDIKIPRIGDELWPDLEYGLGRFLFRLYEANAETPLPRGKGGQLLPVDTSLEFPPDPVTGTTYSLAVAIKQEDEKTVDRNRRQAESGARLGMTGFPHADRPGPVSWIVGSHQFRFRRTTPEQQGPPPESDDVVTYTEMIKGGDTNPLGHPTIWTEEMGFVSRYVNEANIRLAGIVVATCLGSDELRA